MLDVQAILVTTVPASRETFGEAIAPECALNAQALSAKTIFMSRRIYREQKLQVHSIQQSRSPKVALATEKSRPSLKVAAAALGPRIAISRIHAEQRVAIPEFTQRDNRMASRNNISTWMKNRRLAHPPSLMRRAQARRNSHCIVRAFATTLEP